MKVFCLYKPSGEINHAATARMMREKLGPSQKAIAWRMKIRQCELSKLLLGDRNWSESLARKYLDALEKAK